MIETHRFPEADEQRTTIVKRVIKKHGISLPIVEARPTQLSEGDANENANPILIAGGWSTDENTYIGLQKALAQQGRVVVTVGHPRRGGDYPMRQRDVSVQAPQVEWIKAQNLLTCIEGTTVPDRRKFDVFAHSEGAINTLVAACEEPEKFGNIILFGPGGLQGEDNVISLIKRFVNKMSAERDDAGRDRSETLESRYAQLSPRGETEGGVKAEWSSASQLKQTMKEGMTPLAKYFLANVRRAVSEGRAIADTDIREMLQYVRSQGVKIVVMQGVDDRAIPLKMVNQSLESGMIAERPGNNKYVDGVIVVPMMHDDPIHHPNAIATTVLGILNTLENIPDTGLRS